MDTKRVDREVLIEETLDEIDGLIARAPEGPEARELRMQAAKLRDTVARWVAVRPEGRQIGAMHELVSELLARVIQVTRTVSGVELSPRQRPTLRELRVRRRR